MRSNRQKVETPMIMRGLLVLGIVGIALLAIMACGDSETMADPTLPQPTVPLRPTIAPLQATPTPPLYAPAVPGWPPAPSTDPNEYPEPPFHYAANPSVNEQIYHSDAVVRARFMSETEGVLRFRVLEYLKGSGPSEITIQAPERRDTSYDKLDAILFLSTSSGASGESGAEASGFQFTESIYDTYKGGFPSGYEINRENRAWMPATSSGNAGRDSATPRFDPGAPAPGRMHEEPLTITQLKATIAWMTASNTEAYQNCVYDAVLNDAYYRKYAAYYGETYRGETEEEVASGLPAATILWETEKHFDNQYPSRWVEGEDAVLFSYANWDDDDNSANGYYGRFTTTRPLPAGDYNPTSRSVLEIYAACNYIPAVSGRLYWTVTVTAPEGTLHEAFFDPVTLTSGVGVDGASGALKPAEFSVGETSTAVTGLTWESGEVVLSLSTQVSLEGYRLEFIELDGSVGLSLEVDDASVDAGAGTVTWGVSGRPWEDGDLLMLRIVGG